MEVTMYTEDKSHDRIPTEMKANMNLDLANLKRKRPVSDMVDANLLKLSSPDLERLLLSNGLVTTPTPTQFFYPKNVTDEQEAYARGFLEALGQLHQQTQDGEVTTVTDGSVISQAQLATVTGKKLQQIPQQYLFTNGSLQGTIVTTNVPTVVDSIAINRTAIPSQYVNMANQPMIVRLKEEAQRVPSTSPAPSVQPINMEEQEVIKGDRKRARNRIAARKCRQRKLDHISTLEDRVGELKGDRDRLQNTASILSEQVALLRQQVMRHKEMGCSILVS